MPTISLCMITRDEEKYIEQCLNSVKDIVDEIIIVDTGSTDKTIQIAKNFAPKAKFFEFKWTDDFSAARNESLKYATKDWILVLDADETISKHDMGTLKKSVENSPDGILGYYFNIRTYTNNSSAAGWVSSIGDRYEESKRASGWFATRLIRLFKNNKGIRFSNRIHETVSESLLKIGKAIDSPVIIHHFGRLDTDKIPDKQKLYTAITKQKADLVQDYHSFYHLGVQMQELGKYEEAVEQFVSSIKLNPGYFKSWMNLGASLIKLKRFTEAENALNKAVNLYPENEDAHNNLGICYANINKPAQAIAEFQKAILLNPKSASVYFNLGMAYDSLNLKSLAYSAFSKAIELNPEYQKRINLNLK